MQDLMTRLQIKSELGFKEMTQQEYEQCKADVYNNSEGNLNDSDGYNCDLCKNKGWIAEVQRNEQFGYYSEVHTPCKCQKARQAIRRLNRSGLKNVVKDYTFDKYETPDAWQQTIKQTALRFCKDELNNWFYIGGQSGAGKTHICTAIAVHYIKHDKEVRYMLWRDEINRIKPVINDAEQYRELVTPLKEADVLYIDDLFKNGKDKQGNVEPPTAADVQLAFEIINYRYNNPNLVTIISSERTLVELNDIDEAIAGRIAERAKESGYCINLRKDKSRNWRMKGLGEI
jgi:DNA replication protein DnaC